MHDGQDADFFVVHRIQQRVRKALAHATPNHIADDGTGQGVINDVLGALLHLGDERCSKVGPLDLVVLRRVIELAFGQLVERDAYDSNPSSGVAKHLGGRARRE